MLVRLCHERKKMLFLRSSKDEIYRSNHIHAPNPTTPKTYFVFAWFRHTQSSSKSRPTPTARPHIGTHAKAFHTQTCTDTQRHAPVHHCAHTRAHSNICTDMHSLHSLTHTHAHTDTYVRTRAWFWWLNQILWYEVFECRSMDDVFSWTTGRHVSKAHGVRSLLGSWHCPWKTVFVRNLVIVATIAHREHCRLKFASRCRVHISRTWISRSPFTSCFTDYISKFDSQIQIDITFSV